MSTALSLAALAYGAAWSAVSPLLGRFSKRLREGYGERVLRTFPDVRADVWIQAASGGEAYLARELFRCLAPETRVLATSCTSQGLSILQAEARETDGDNARPATAYFPFDKPSAMRRVLERTGVRLVALLETELWPGLLLACRELGVPVVLLNGRMTTRSLARYLIWPGLWRDTRPELVLAVSDEDAARFSLLFGDDVVGRMDNIKFDLFDSAPPADAAASPLAGLLPPGTDLAVFGSVRREEETEILAAVAGLLAARPETVIGLFPRHMHRVSAWRELLGRAGLPFTLRSEAAGPVRPGTVVVWDVFGELRAAYGLAGTVFVGGSLKPLGGQNYLEPLAAGVIPVVGPYRSNFAWVGRDLDRRGLVLTATSGAEAAVAMAGALQRPRPRAEVRAEAMTFVEERRGGTLRACQVIEDHLQRRGS